MTGTVTGKAREARRGASGLAYGLIVGLIAVVAIGAIAVMGGEVRALFGVVGTDLQSVAEAQKGGGDGSGEEGGQQSPSPQPQDDGLSGIEPLGAGTVDVLANDQGSSPTLIGIGSQPGFGTAATGPGAGEVTYTADADFPGSDSFTYEMDPGDGSTQTATVTVTGPDPLTVTTSDDVSDPNDGVISLREAVAHVKNKGSDETIEIDSGALGGDGEINLTNEIALDFAHAATIEPASGRATIDGQQQTRIFNISDGDVTLRDLTIKLGFVDALTASGPASVDGGAIFVDGSGPSPSLTIERTGFFSNGVGLGNVTGPARGGAIRFSGSGSLTVRDSTFGSNRAFSGGAIRADGTDDITLENVTFFENAAECDNDSNDDLGGPGCDKGFEGNGGAVAVGTTPTSIVNSTFVDNDAQAVGGALSAAFTTVNLTNSILLLNGASEDAAAADMNAFDTDLSGSNNAYAALRFTGSGSNTLASSISSSASAVFGTTSPGVANHCTGPPLVSITLNPTGPAIDSGTSTGAPAEDLCGTSRGASPDLGALEVSP